MIDRTEAMTVVDVNTGKFVGSGGNLEETVTKNNLEAAEEIVRQLRLRDIGGIIVIDFIDMVLESNRDLVLRRLVECLGRDRTQHQVAEVTSLGLVQMTRKRIGTGLLESFSETCEPATGRGVIAHDPTTKHTPPSPNRAAVGARAATGAAMATPAACSGRLRAAEERRNLVITDDVKNALAQIAASTIPHSPDATLPDSTLPDSARPEVVESAADVSAEPVDSAASASRKPAVKPDAEAAVQTVPKAAGTAEVPIAILDIPVKKGSRSNARRISAQDAEQILDSVLEALPEPKQPGQGRSRVSRRASSQATVTTHSDGTAS